MKLSEKMNMAIDDKKSTFFALPASTVSIWASEVAQLEEENAALKRENKHFAKVISNVWDALNEEGITISGARGQMLADALLTGDEDE